MDESGGLRCDPGGTGSEVNAGSYIEVDKSDSEGNTNLQEWSV